MLLVGPDPFDSLAGYAIVIQKNIRHFLYFTPHQQATCDLVGRYLLFYTAEPRHVYLATWFVGFDRRAQPAMAACTAAPHRTFLEVSKSCLESRLQAWQKIKLDEVERKIGSSRLSVLLLTTGRPLVSHKRHALPERPNKINLETVTGLSILGLFCFGRDRSREISPSEYTSREHNDNPVQ
ncbi:hypothetical protein J6590_027109 [Homalodisca vitripennis]|nr:hypothetical protein J6590_027109 [Homalodisca vitripennis]